MRRQLIAASALLALACGERKDDGPKSAATPANATPPVTATATSGRDAPAPAPVSGYDKARRVALGVLARPIDPATVHAAVDDWAAADAALRRLGRDARAGEVATLLVAGAAEHPRDVSKATTDQWRAIAALVIAVVLEDASAGRRDATAARLLATATLGRDIGDAATVAAAARACAVVSAAAADDTALAEACATLAEDANEPR